MEIEIGGEKILLRPTFKNMAAMETEMGSISSLVFKYGKNISANPTESEIRSALPPLTDSAKVIFYNQADPKYSIEEIYEKCLAEGVKCGAYVMLFLVRCTSGNKLAKEPTEKQKKNLKKSSQVENQ
jgi:hypothetical protein